MSVNQGTRASEVLAAAATGFETFLGRLGGDADSVLGQVGLSPPDLAEPTRPISLSTYCHMLDGAAKNVGRRNFGLLYGRQFEPQMFGLIGFIALSSPTLRSALKNFIELFPMHQNGTETRLFQDKDELRMEYRILDSSILSRRQDAEFTIAAFANVIKSSLGRSWAPVRVEFEHASPGDMSDYHSVFDAEIEFLRPTNALVFRPERLEISMPAANLQLLDLLRASLTAVACHGGKQNIDIVQRAKAEIRGQLPSGLVTLENVADRLRLPSWTLRRRLADEGVTFRILTEEVRKAMAACYLRDDDTPLTDIGALLGYSEASAFSRAFRQWYGVSPRVFRKAH